MKTKIQKTNLNQFLGHLGLLLTLVSIQNSKVEAAEAEPFEVKISLNPKQCIQDGVVPKSAAYDDEWFLKIDSSYADSNSIVGPAGPNGSLETKLFISDRNVELKVTVFDRDTGIFSFFDEPGPEHGMDILIPRKKITLTGDGHHILASPILPLSGRSGSPSQCLVIDTFDLTAAEVDTWRDTPMTEEQLMWGSEINRGIEGNYLYKQKIDNFRQVCSLSIYREDPQVLVQQPFDKLVQAALRQLRVSAPRVENLGPGDKEYINKLNKFMNIYAEIRALVSEARLEELDYINDYPRINLWAPDKADYMECRRSVLRLADVVRKNIPELNRLRKKMREVFTNL